MRSESHSVTSRDVFKSVVQRLSLWAEPFKFRTTVPQVWLTYYRAASRSNLLTRGHLRCCRHWRGNAGSEEGERREYGEPRKRTQRWPARSRGEFARWCQARACFNNELQHPRSLRSAQHHRHRHRHSQIPPCSRNSTAWDGSTITAIYRPCSHSCSSDRPTATSRSPARARRCERTR